MSTEESTTRYAARLEVDYPEKLDRLTTFFRIIGRSGSLGAIGVEIPVVHHTVIHEFVELENIFR